MNMKKIAKIACISFASLMLLAGCGSKDEKVEKEANIDSKISTKKTTLEVYTSKGKMTNYIQHAAEKFNEKTGANIHLEITNVASGTATVQMITPKLVSHEEMPDIVSITDSSAAGVLEKFESEFYSATDFGFYKKYGSDFYKQKLDVLKAQSSKGKVIPWANDFVSALSFYQPEKFKEIGVNFEDIKSWDEYIEVAKKVKEKTGTYGIALSESGDQEVLIDILAQQNEPLLDKKGNINLATPKAKKAADIIKKMVDADIVKFYNTQDTEKAFQETAMFVAGGWYAMNMSINFPDAAGKWRMAPIVPFSVNDKGKSPISGGSSYYVPKNSKHSLLAQQFLSFMLSDEDCLELALQEGVAPTNSKAYSLPGAEKEFEYYGNQKYYKLLSEVNKDTANTTFPATYSDATAYTTTASYNYWKTNNFKSSYEKEADNFAQKYNVKVNK